MTFRLLRLVPIVVALAGGIASSQEQSKTPAKPQSVRAKPTEESRKKDLIRSLLQSAHQLSGQLAPVDRADLLIQMAAVAGKENPEQVRLWVKEALRTAAEMHPSSERSGLEARALRSLAMVNGEEALAMLSTLELPASQSRVSDARSIAATEVFEGYLDQHPTGWERIAAAARSLGDSGFYPYRAVQGVIDRIGRKSPEAAATLIQQSIGYFMHSAPDPVAANQMAGLLKQGASFIDRSQLSIDLHGIVGHMFETDGDTNRNGNPVASSDPSLDQVTLTVLLPSIESVDPEWAAKLRHDNPGVQTDGVVLTFDLRDRPAMTAALQVSGNNGTKGQSENTSGSASAPAGNDNNSGAGFPMDAVITLPPTIDLFGEDSEPEDLIGLSPSPASSEEDPAKAGRDFEEQMKRAGSDRVRLSLLMGRATTLTHLGRKQESAMVLERLFNLADQMFRQSVDEKPSEKWSKRPGVFALTMTIQFCANSASELMLERIQNLRMLPLRAHLLVRFAEALGANGTIDDSVPSEKKEQDEKPPQPPPNGIHAPEGAPPR